MEVPAQVFADQAGLNIVQTPWQAGVVDMAGVVLGGFVVLAVQRSVEAFGINEVAVGAPAEHDRVRERRL